MNFIQACLKGKAKPEDINDWVERWHKSQSKLPLHQWLGLTLTEYMEFVTKPDSITKSVQNATQRLRQPWTKKKYSRKKREQ